MRLEGELKEFFRYLHKIPQVRIVVLSILSGILLCACGSGDKPVKPVAQVGKYYLEESQLRSVIPQGVKGADSALLAKGYIDRWIKDHLLIEKANDEKVDNVNIDKMVEDYRNSLLLAAYQQKYIKEKLDTLVGDKEVEQYYRANLQNFQLKSNIVQVRYVKLGKKAPNIPKVKQWVQSNRPADRKQLENYCADHAENYFLDDNSWLLFDDLLKEIPLKNINAQGFTGPRFVEMEDSAFVYFVNIKAFQTKEAPSPVGYVKGAIREIILNKRKTKLLKQLEDNMYKEALDNGDFEILSEKK